MFQDRALRRIFKSKREEATCFWRKLKRKIKSIRIRWEEKAWKRNAYNVLVGKRPFRRLRCRWKMTLKCILKKQN
jgi:hypothetical protein